jgi:hypothetical protein
MEARLDTEQLPMTNEIAKAECGLSITPFHEIAIQAISQFVKTEILLRCYNC